MRSFPLMAVLALACADAPRSAARDSTTSQPAPVGADASPSRSSGSPAVGVLPAALPGDARAAADSASVTLEGFTLIAFAPQVTQAQMDSSEELSTVLDDFGHYLAEASDSIAALGFELLVRPTGRIRLVEPNGSREVRPSPDSSYVGYVLVAPGRREQIYYGVRMDGELVAAARAFRAAAGP